MIAAGFKQAARAVIGRRATFLAGYMLRGAVAFVASGFQWNPAFPPECSVRYGKRHSQLFANRTFAIFLLHILRLRRVRQLTASLSCTSDGAGYQVLMRMRAMGFAKAEGLEYVHTPLFDIAHADCAMPEYCRKWEEMFRLGDGFRSVDRLDLGVLDFSWAPNSAIPDLFGRKDAALAIEAVIPDLKRRFREANPRDRKAKAPLDVCVHVRRGDISAETHPYMWTGDAKIRGAIASVRSCLDRLGADYTVTIVSLGEEAEFRQTFGPEIAYFLNEDSDAAVRRLAQADVLVMARSCFSYVAAIVSDGIRIYEDWDNPALAGWLVMAEDGSVDPEALAKAVRDRQAAKVAAD